MGKLQTEIDAFHEAIHARALLIALAWAGGDVRRLSAAAGLGKEAARLWVHRKRIPPRAALVLESIDGFPLSANEMRPDIDWFRFRQQIRCNNCGKRINPPNYRRGYRSLLTDRFKVQVKGRLASR